MPQKMWLLKTPQRDEAPTDVLRSPPTLRVDEPKAVKRLPIYYLQYAFFNIIIFH